MALANFTYPFGGLASPWAATLAPIHNVHHIAGSTNSLLYGPADHRTPDDDTPPPPGSDYYKNSPYAPPQAQRQAAKQPPPQYYQYNNNNANPNGNGNGNGSNRRKGGSTYLPPIPPPGARNTQFPPRQGGAQFSHQQQQQQQQVYQKNVAFKSISSVTGTASSTRTYGESTYGRYPAPASTSASASASVAQSRQPQYYNAFGSTQTRTGTTTTASATATASGSASSSLLGQSKSQVQIKSLPNFGTKVETPATTYGVAGGGEGGGGVGGVGGSSSIDAASAGGASEALYPERPPGFTRVQAGQGSRTQVHAVLDYDVEEGDDENDDEHTDDDTEQYYDAEDRSSLKDGSSKSTMPTVTPIQGPIFLKNGTVPVVPLFSYPTINNGSFVQIPIWWTALSVALGLDVRGDVIKGVPCIKRYHQLFCPTAGNSYPIDKIERFIDDNKALMRRMYGDFEMNLDPGGPRQQTKRRKRRFIDEPDIFIPPGAYPARFDDDAGTEPHVEEAGDSYFGKLRSKRQSNRNNNSNRGSGQNSGGPGNPGSTGTSSSGRLDACESKIEIVTPYWASNSAGKIRAIVNTQHFEQAIHQEICSKSQTARCENDCGCEQKYKWHRLLAYDPDNDCKGIFMDWFLFPSCCVCRCNP